MLATRGAWVKTIAVLTIPFVALAYFIALGAIDRIDRAHAASDELDRIFPFATVAAIEGSLHEEGSLAIALAAGLIEADEFTTATEATDEARVELVDELTYHEPDSAIGTSLAAIEAALTSIDTTRVELLDGTFEGLASEPYRSLFVLTADATRATMPMLFAPSGAVPLAELDAARSAAGEAVFESTASIFESTGTEPVSAALDRLAAADLMLHRTGPTALIESVDTALDSPEATAGAEGTALIAAGESPNLLEWADATVPWVLAYGDPEISTLESATGSMGLRAERAEDAAFEYVIIAACAWAALLIVSLALTRSIVRGRRDVEAGLDVGSTPEMAASAAS